MWCNRNGPKSFGKQYVIDTRLLKLAAVVLFIKNLAENSSKTVVGITELRYPSLELLLQVVLPSFTKSKVALFILSRKNVSSSSKKKKKKRQERKVSTYLA